MTQPPAPDLFALATPEADTTNWPRLKLNGVLTAGGSAGAVLNHTVVEPGESIEGVTVVAIADRGVLLEYEGTRIVLETGQSTR